MSEIKLDCECVVHTEDRNGTHGGAPHIHYCQLHQQRELRPLDEETVFQWLQTDAAYDALAEPHFSSRNRMLAELIRRPLRPARARPGPGAGGD
jgi:hypothetical protein